MIMTEAGRLAFRRRKRKRFVFAAFAAACALSGVGALPAAAASRLALVIAQADYRDARLITAASDAARIVEALNAAGFATEGGADLEQHLIREKIRNLTEKALASEEVEAIFIYVVGRVAQLNGENLILPVGAPIERASDIILNGFRLNDLIGALRTVPAKARIVVIDAAAPPERLTADKKFSAGLALLEAPEGFLIAFSQNPGRALLEPQPPMGLFAKGFLDALQQPAASYIDTFAFARQRVFEESRNQQMPWETEKLNERKLSFYPPPEGVTLSSIADGEGDRIKLGTLARDEAFKRVIASDNIADYQAFLVSFPKDEAVATVQYNLAVRREAEVWAHALRENRPEGYWSYIAAYPDGGNLEVARQRLADLRAAPLPSPDFAPVAPPSLPPPLPNLEMIASSASMPVNFLPKPPSLMLPQIASAVTAAAATPLAAAVRQQLPTATGVAFRPAWAPAKSPASPPVASGQATPAPAAGFRPLAAPITPPSRASIGQPEPGKAASSFRPIAVPAQQPSALARPLSPGVIVRPQIAPSVAPARPPVAGIPISPQPSRPPIAIGPSAPTRPPIAATPTQSPGGRGGGFGGRPQAFGAAAAPRSFAAPPRARSYSAPAASQRMRRR